MYKDRVKAVGYLVIILLAFWVITVIPFWFAGLMN